MSNELNNIVCLNADGAYEGVAIGGDRYHLFASVSVLCLLYQSLSQNDIY